MSFRVNIENVEEFDTAVKQAEPLLVQFTAGWCAACHKIEQKFNDDLVEKNETISWIGVDVDEFAEIVERYDNFQMPCMLVFQAGQLMHSLSGKELVGDPLSVLKTVKNLKARVFTQDEDF
jgi:thiol-disulfide isomerase/thioredoxin